MYSFWITVFFPAGDGNPPTWLISQFAAPKLNMQPVAPGTANELSTCLAYRTSGGGSDRTIDAGSPLMGWFGAGGLVVPVVRSSMIGLLLEPTVHLFPRNGLMILTLSPILIRKSSLVGSSKKPAYSGWAYTAVSSGSPNSPGWMSIFSARIFPKTVSNSKVSRLRVCANVIRIGFSISWSNPPIWNLPLVITATKQREKRGSAPSGRGGQSEKSKVSGIGSSGAAWAAVPMEKVSAAAASAAGSASLARRLEKRGNFTDGPFVVPSGNGTRTPDDRVQSQRTRDFRRRPATGTPLIPNRIVKPGHWRFNTRDQANLRIFSFLLAAAIMGNSEAGDIVIFRMPHATAPLPIARLCTTRIREAGPPMPRSPCSLERPTASGPGPTRWGGADRRGPVLGAHGTEPVRAGPNR